MAFDGLKKDEQEAIMAEVKERMKNKEVYEYPEDNADPESLQKRLQQTCGSGGGGRSRRRRRGGSRKERSRACRKTKRIMKAFKEDLANIFLLTTKVTYDKEQHKVSIKLQETVRNAKLPNLDGLYGGKACIREDGRATTKYLEADEEKKYYGTEEYTTEHGACDLQLCMVNDDPMQPVVEKNCVSMWTAWTKWGKCNKDCGDDGNRKRTRWTIFKSPPVAQMLIFSDTKYSLPSENVSVLAMKQKKKQIAGQRIEASPMRLLQMR